MDGEGQRSEPNRRVPTSRSTPSAPSTGYRPRPGDSATLRPWRSSSPRVRRMPAAERVGRALARPRGALGGRTPWRPGAGRDAEHELAAGSCRSLAAAERRSRRGWPTPAAWRRAPAFRSPTCSRSTRSRRSSATTRRALLVARGGDAGRNPARARRAVGDLRARQLRDRRRAPGRRRPWVVSPTVAACLPVVGMNEHGGAFGVDSLVAADDRDGIPRVFAAREVLDARDPGDLLSRARLAGRAGGYAHGRRLRRRPRRGGRADGGAGRARRGAAAHTNHYLHPELAASAGRQRDQHQPARAPAAAWPDAAGRARARTT